jgi:hypothetical protein
MSHADERNLYLWLGFTLMNDAVMDCPNTQIRLNIFLSPSLHVYGVYIYPCR